jgi:hypothetical protein
LPFDGGGFAVRESEPPPYMLTVGRLKEMLRDVPDQTVVVLVVPPTFPVDPRFTRVLNVRASYPGGPAVVLHQVDVPGDERDDA